MPDDVREAVKCPQDVDSGELNHMARYTTFIRRDQEECKTVLAEFDRRTLEMRAARLSFLPVALSYADYDFMPARVDALLSEACECYLIGAYVASLAALAIATEYGLQVKLGKSARTSLRNLVDIAEKRRLGDALDFEALRDLAEYRNNVFHSDLDDLSRGLKLRRQMTGVTKQGVLEEPEWEEFKPENRTDKEKAAQLHGQVKVAGLLITVRRFLYKLFAGR